MTRSSRSPPAGAARRRHHRGRLPGCLARRLGGGQRDRARDRHGRWPGDLRPGARQQDDIDDAPGARLSRPRRPRIQRLSRPPTSTSSTRSARPASEVLELIGEMVTLARAACATMSSSRPMDATRSDRRFLLEVLKVGDRGGATTINIPDTVGYAHARRVRRDDRRHPSSNVPGAEKVIISTSTATTTWAWRSPTRWPACSPARGRSNARSTASASAPATPRSKRW